MILSSRFVSVALSVAFLSLSASAADQVSSHIVVKSDGSVGRYVLLPVHYDPSHASAVESRLNRAASLRSSAPSLPAQYQISTSALPPVRDQGERGTCAYFATVGVLETYYLAKSPANLGLNLSEECLVDVRDWMSDQGASYKGADDPSSRPDPDGDLPNSIIMTVIKDGVPTSSQFSSTVNCVYDGTNVNGTDLSLTDYLSTFTQVSGASLAYGKGLNFDQNVAPTIDAVKAAIAANHPVEVGIIVYNEFMNEVDWRFDPTTDVSSDIAGGHAIMLTGYKVENGKTIFTFKNSWGATWGNAGYGTLDDGVLTNAWAFEPSFDFAVTLHD
jgi:hypothetical protein